MLCLGDCIITFDLEFVIEPLSRLSVTVPLSSELSTAITSISNTGVEIDRQKLDAH